MRSLARGFAATLLAIAALQAQEPAPDQSLERMKSVLAHPPLQLTVPEAEANFKIHVKAIHPMQDIFEKPPWQLPPIVWRIPAMGPSTAFGSMPIVSLDLLAIARSVGAANRARDERAARGEVQRAIADYCAAQPNANTIQICSTSPAIR
jgi:hypothetical protein